MALLPAPHRFTVDEYHRMAAARVFGEDDRVELVEGEIIEMAPIGSRHAASSGASTGCSTTGWVAA